jgi:prepilin-type N-terminal cleavage/methylation domain-containing protein
MNAFIHPGGQTSAKTTKFPNLPGGNGASRRSRKGAGDFSGLAAAAFTLIEMLVVISIIAILAGMVLYLVAPANDARVRRAVEAQMAQLELAIGQYHADKGFYPPATAQPQFNTLYYELVGAVSKAGGYDLLNGDSILVADFTTAFAPGITGILNSSASGITDAKDPDGGITAKNYLANWRENQVKPITLNGKSVKILAVPVKGPIPDVTPWYYRCPGQNNPEGFDLWTEALVAGKPQVFSNWKQGK